VIIENGFVRGKNITEKGFDVNGNPIEASETLGEPIPCYIRQLKHDFLARTEQGNNYISASYEVLIDLQQFDYEHINLEYSNGKVLGDFRILYIQDLAAVNATQILV
jgi:hypothetical protein